jgi:hypothetical protein
MIFKHLIIVLVGVVLLLLLISIAFDITLRIHLQPAGATKNAIFGDILNNTNKNSTTTTTITSSINNTNRTAKGPTTDEITHIFEESFAKLVNDTRSLSLSYQDEIGKWQQLNQHDNGSMITITNDYLPKFQQIAERVQELIPPSEGYGRALDLFSQSIQLEMASHIHFRNFLATGDLKEDERSIQLFSDAFKYEKEAFDAFKAATTK